MDRIRKRLPSKPILIVIGLMISANIVGSLAVTFFMLVIAPIPESDLALSQANPRETLLIIFGNVLFVVFANGMLWLNSRRFSRWYPRLLAKFPAHEVPQAARREVLNFPLRMSLISLGIWVIAGLVFGLRFSGSVWAAIGPVIVGGGFAMALTYFVLELYWRRMLVLFFPDGRLRATPAFRLSVFARLLVVFLLISLYPVGTLVVLSYGRAHAMLGAANPQAILQNLLAVEIFILASTLCAAVGMAYFVNRTISGPMSRIERAMAQVEKNDLQVQLVVYSNDEIGYVSERFNAMVRSLRQGERLRTLLNLYISPEVARQALEQGTALGGQTVECAVLFADIRDFTALSEEIKPEQLVSLLNRYMSVMVETIVACHGMVNKFGGDSLLAVFGTPLNPDPRYTQSAVSAAVSMRQALVRFNQEQRKTGGPELRIGIGIASGPLVAGNIGGEARIEYTVIGETVNLASRLQTMTKELGLDLLIDEQTVEMINHQAGWQFEALPAVKVRGKHDPVKVYTLAAQVVGA